MFTFKSIINVNINVNDSDRDSMRINFDVHI